MPERVPDVEEQVLHPRDTWQDKEAYDRQAHRLIDGHTAGDRAVVTHVTCWHPTLPATLPIAS